MVMLREARKSDVKSAARENPAAIMCMMSTASKPFSAASNRAWDNPISERIIEGITF